MASDDIRCPTTEVVRFGKAEKNIFTVTIGPTSKKQTFELQRGLLTTSEVLSDSLKTSSKTVHSFPDEDPRLFNLYVNWLHFRTLATKDLSSQSTPDSKLSDKESKTPPGNPKEDSEYYLLARLYVLGQRFKDTTFVDDVSDAFKAKVREYIAGNEHYKLPGPQCIRYIYDNTEEVEELKYLLVEAYAREAGREAVEEIQHASSSAYRQFHTDVIVELLDIRDDADDHTRIADFENCRYHVHTADQTCSSGNSRKRKHAET